jgi:hypothetical protein
MTDTLKDANCRLLVRVALFFAVIIGPTAVSSIAAPESVRLTGLYNGKANGSTGAPIDITMNLRYTEGHYTAQFLTSARDFDARDVTYEAGHLTAKLDTGSELGSLDLTPVKSGLQGRMDLLGPRELELTRTGDALPDRALMPRLDLTPDEWHQDVAALAARLPQVHANAFFSLSRDAFDAEIAALDRRAKTVNGDAMYVGLLAITKSIGDGHTGMGDPPDRRVMPIEFSRFGDDLRVTAAGPSLERALGTRLIKIGGVPVAEVWARVLTLTPRAELRELRIADAPVYLSRGYALHGLGLIPDRNFAVYTLEDDSGRLFDLGVKGLSPGQNVTMKSVYPPDALWTQKPGQPFWCTALMKDRAVYCNWRSYEGLDKTSAAMFALVNADKPKKLIIDMRDNGGGDNVTGYADMVKPIKTRADLNAPGKLFVLIGAQTFSAAMNNAAQFKDETKALLVGQTIGERPNSYQEPRQFHLPNSHLVVRASTLYYSFRKGGENVIHPDREIIPTWDDMKLGRDPVLDWVLKQPAQP